jgi:membrane-associated phospholipid phosphatase
MAPPTCSFPTGKHIRYALLLAVVSYLIYFLYTGISSDPSSTNVVFICNTDTFQMTECSGLDDVTTCGNEATCIESSCGYKLFDHIDISIAGSSDPYDEDGATSTTSFFTVASVFYSLVPYLLGFIYLVLFLMSGNLVPLMRFFVFGVISVMNEGIFKHILQEERPTGSCLYFKSYGMPSGHAATSIGLLTYILLELYVLHPHISCGRSCQQQTGSYYFEWGYGWQKQADATTTNANDGDGSVSIDINEGSEPVVNGEVNVFHSRAPLLNNTQSTYSARCWTCHLYALFYIALLLPVPLSRVYLHDHYRNQVLVGACIGVGVSILLYLGLIRGCGMRKRIETWIRSEWGNWWGWKFGWSEGFF